MTKGTIPKIKGIRCPSCGAKDTIFDCGTFTYCGKCLEETIVIRDKVMRV
jgi:ribosomal protein S27E